MQHGKGIRDRNSSSLWGGQELSCVFYLSKHALFSERIYLTLQSAWPIFPFKAQINLLWAPVRKANQPHLIWPTELKKLHLGEMARATVDDNGPKILRLLRMYEWSRYTEKTVLPASCQLPVILSYSPGSTSSLLDYKTRPWRVCHMVNTH